MTIKELREICQATAPAPERETFTGKKARIFSIYLTKLFLKTSITPNQITVISVFVFFIGMSLFLFGKTGFAILGALCVFFATILDGSDGEVARFRQTKNPVGGLYVEPVSHDIQYGLMFFILGIAAYLSTKSFLPLVFAFAASTFKLMTRLLENRYWFMTKAIVSDEEIKELRKNFSARPAYKRFLSWVKRNTMTSNGLILPLLLAAIFSKLSWFLYAYGTAHILLWILVFIKQIRALPTAATVVMKAEVNAGE